MNKIVGLNILSKEETEMKNNLVKRYFELSKLEQPSSLFSYYGGPNQLLFEIQELKMMLHNLVQELNFGSKDAAFNKLQEVTDAKAQDCPAVTSAMEYQDMKGWRQ